MFVSVATLSLAEQWCFTFTTTISYYSKQRDRTETSCIYLQVRVFDVLIWSSRSAGLCRGRPGCPLRKPLLPTHPHLCPACVRDRVGAAICAACVFASVGMHGVCIPAVVCGWREMDVASPKKSEEANKHLGVGSRRCVHQLLRAAPRSRKPPAPHSNFPNRIS